MTPLTHGWIIRVAFEDGESRFYRRLDSANPSDFTTMPDDAQRFESEQAAFQVLDRLKPRYKRLRQITVEEVPPDKC